MTVGIEPGRADERRRRRHGRLVGTGLDLATGRDSMRRGRRRARGRSRDRSSAAATTGAPRSSRRSSSYATTAVSGPTPHLVAVAANTSGSGQRVPAGVGGSRPGQLRLQVARSSDPGMWAASCSPRGSVAPSVQRTSSTRGGASDARSASSSVAGISGVTRPTLRASSARPVRPAGFPSTRLDARARNGCWPRNGRGVAPATESGNAMSVSRHWAARRSFASTRAVQSAGRPRARRHPGR